MKTKIILLMSFITANFISCCHNKDIAEIIISPLHPYSLSPADYDSTIDKSRDFINKYYFVEGACKPTDELSKTLDSFLIQTVKKDSTDFFGFGRYIVDVYRQSNSINAKFREEGDGMFPNLLQDYNNDLLFQYEWVERDFIGCKYYKEGQVVKTVYNKNGNLFNKKLTSSKVSDKPITVQEVLIQDSLLQQR